ncbi:MAG: hypothetical protein ACEQSU_16645 [Microgenomates group bacterium]
MFAVIVLCSALTGACETHRVALEGVNELACGAEAQAKAAGLVRGDLRVARYGCERGQPTPTP